MKQVFLKAALFTIAFAISAIVGNIKSNACDRKLVSKSCLRQKQTARKTKPATVKETAANYPDFILTNSILRF